MGDNMRAWGSHGYHDRKKKIISLVKLWYHEIKAEEFLDRGRGNIYIYVYVYICTHTSSVWLQRNS